MGLAALDHTLHFRGIRAVSIVAPGGGDGGEEVLDGGEVVGQDDPPGSDLELVHVELAVGLGLDQAVVVEELRVVVAAPQGVEVERGLRGDDDEGLAEAGAGVVVGPEDVDVREGQPGRLDPGAEEPAVARGPARAPCVFSDSRALAGGLVIFLTAASALLSAFASDS